MLKKIEGFPDYYVSSDGRVFSDKGKVRRELKLSRTKDGYLKIMLFREDGVKKNFLVHRLVAEAFIPNPNNLPHINHKNEIKDDNRVDNLEWCTVSYNINYGTRNERVSEAMTGREITEEWRRKISKTLTDKYNTTSKVLKF